MRTRLGPHRPLLSSSNISSIRLPGPGYQILKKGAGWGVVALLRSLPQDALSTGGRTAPLYFVRVRVLSERGLHTAKQATIHPQRRGGSDLHVNGLSSLRHPHPIREPRSVDLAPPFGLPLGTRGLDLSRHCLFPTDKGKGHLVPLTVGFFGFFLVKGGSEYPCGNAKARVGAGWSACAPALPTRGL